MAHPNLVEFETSASHAWKVPGLQEDAPKRHQQPSGSSVAQKAHRTHDEDDDSGPWPHERTVGGIDHLYQFDNAFDSTSRDLPSDFEPSEQLTEDNERERPPLTVVIHSLYPRRNDAESINRALDDSMWLARAHSIGHSRQHLNLIGYALVVNSVALAEHRRKREPLAA